MAKATKINDSTATIGFEANRAHCLVALPVQIFRSSQIPICLWFLVKNKAADANHQDFN